MDMRELAEIIIKDESIKDIPAIYVMRVAIAVMGAINSGECFFDKKEEKVYVDSL